METVGQECQGDKERLAMVDFIFLKKIIYTHCQVPVLTGKSHVAFKPCSQSAGAV